MNPVVVYNVSMRYTDKLSVQNYLLKSIDVGFDTTLNQYIDAMSEYADQMAGYPIYRTEPAAYLYDGNNAAELVISPVHTINAVTVDSVTVEPIAAPYNSDIKTKLTLAPTLQYFTKGTANVSVAGVHCLKKTLPESIKWAVTVLVALIVQQVDEQRDGISSEKIGDYTVSFSDQKQRSDYDRAKEIIHSYEVISF